MTRTTDEALSGLAARQHGVFAADQLVHFGFTDMLVRQGLPAPVHQHVIRADDRAFVARVDLAYPEWMVVIEYDSVEHHTGTAAHIRDSTRRDAIGDLGYAVLTATIADLRDRGERLARLIRHRRDRAT